MFKEIVAIVIGLLLFSFIAVMAIRFINKKKGEKNIDYYEEDLNEVKRLLNNYYQTYIDPMTCEGNVDYLSDQFLHEGTPLDILSVLIHEIEGKVDYKYQMGVNLALYRQQEYLTGFLNMIEYEHKMDIPTMTDDDFDFGFSLCIDVIEEIVTSAIPLSSEFATVIDPMEVSSIFEIPNIFRSLNILIN